jgi:hypothetical protein
LSDPILKSLTFYGHWDPGERPGLTLKSNPSEVGERPANRVGERGDAAPGAAVDVILDDSDDQGRRKALRRAFVLHENSFTFTPYGNRFDQLLFDVR